MTYKLPSHLEPYRDCIQLIGYDTVEQQYDSEYTFPHIHTKRQIDLLQRLYEAKKLK